VTTVGGAPAKEKKKATISAPAFFQIIPN